MNYEREDGLYALGTLFQHHCRIIELMPNVAMHGGPEFYSVMASRLTAVEVLMADGRDHNNHDRSKRAKELFLEIAANAIAAASKVERQGMW